jgi:hypothetical protein
MKGLAVMVEAVLAGHGVHGHAADGVADGRGVVGVMIVIAVTGVVVAAAAGTLWRAVSVGVFIVVHHSLRRL